MKRLASLVLALLSMPAWATTYYFLGGIDSTRFPHQTCGAGICADYPAGARITGSFTTAAPLAANLPATEITGSITAYGFSDGVNAYSNADANARIVAFTVATDGAGKPSAATVQLQLWQAAAPHDAGNNRVDLLLIGSPTGAGNNVTCNIFGSSPVNGVLDVCTGYIGSTDSSFASTTLANAWSVDVPIPIPPPTPTTYSYSGKPFGTIANHTTCGVGVCSNFTSSMHVTGTFTTLDRLPPNFGPGDVSGLISAYSFSDGVQTFASGDPLARVVAFALQTDAGGVPAALQVVLERWQGAPPHLAGSRVDEFGISSTGASAVANGRCDDDAVVSPIAGTPDVCLAPALSTDSSWALADGGTWAISVAGPATAAAVPMLDREGLAALAAALLALGALALRRRAKR